jgi:tetratricopeptide (TPR) repeat protein
MRHLRAVMLALFALLFSFGVLAAKPGKADKGDKADAAEATKADKEGQKLEKKKDFEAARDAYNKSLEKKDNPDVRLRLAGAEEKLGHLVEASEKLKKVIDAENVKGATKQKAQAKLKNIEKRIPTLQIDVPKDFKGTVYLDDEELGAGTLASPIPVNPGSHKVRAEAEGSKPFSESIEVAV